MYYTTDSNCFVSFFANCITRPITAVCLRAILLFPFSTQAQEHGIESLRQTGSVTRGYLGIVIQDLTPDLAKSFGLKDH